VATDLTPLVRPCSQATSPQKWSARVDFHRLLDNATSAELRAGTDGTKWTNEQLLFHMLFGYLLVHNLLIVVKAFTRLPRRLQGLRGHA
jgi:hypothetical protein